jgi:hypothetical protein
MLRQARLEISRFPHKELTYMPGSATTPDQHSARIIALCRVAFRNDNNVGTRNQFSIVAQ